MNVKYDVNGLVPMIIQDADSGLVLSLFYGNKESIEKMQKTKYVWRYSRSKKKVMRKGEISGNIQKVVAISNDCDNNALLIMVSPKGPACHTGKASCFESQSILQELVSTIRERATCPSGSYTSKILKEREMIVEKLREECEELIRGKTKSNIAWEAADLIYFILVYLENRNVPFNEVLKELRSRRK